MKYSFHRRFASGFLPLALSTFTGAGAAVAQDAEPARVVVIGSYIPTAESEGPLPVTIYSANVLQKIGANTPVEGLRQLPSFVGNTATENDSNGGNGSAFVAIRGLGPANTLTLINGRRAFGFANVNALPIGALDRTEVLKDGAGAIYGSDAVAGVVNFVLINGAGTTPLNGVELDLLYGNTTEKDARVLQAYLRGGFSNEKMAIAFAAEYYDRNAIFSRDRSISASADRRFLGGNNGGSASFPGRVTLGGVMRVLIDPTVASPASPAAYRAYGGANSADPFNFRQFTPAIPAQEKYMYYVTGQYNIFGKAMVAYADLMYAKTKQDNGLAPAPFSLSRAEILQSPYNPFVATTPSSPNRITSLSYRLTDELGLRKSFYDDDYWRYTFGLRGEFVFKHNPFVDYLNYDGGIVYERTDQLRIDSGDAQRNLLVTEIAWGNFNPFRGQASAVSGTSNVYDPATGAVAGTQVWDNVAAAQRASYVGRSFTYSHDFLIDARLSGNLFPMLPQGGIGFNVGAEFRQSRTTQLPDPVQAQGNQLGFNASPNTKYKQEVKSFFAELSVPIVTPKMKVPFVKAFDVSAAIRYEEFESFDQKPDPANVAAGNPTRAKFDSGVKPRFTVRYQPIEDLTLRGSYGESFRAPGPVALFDPVSTSFPIILDTFNGNNSQLTGGIRQGGNTRLQPEESKSWTAGLAFTPRWVKGLSLTVDYYQVRTSGVFLGGADFAQLVASINGNSLLSGGAAFPGRFGYVIDPNNPDAAPPAGAFVGRNPLVPGGGGEIYTIFANTANASKRFVQGIDTTASYRLPWDTYGQFTLSAGANYFLSWKAEAIPGVGTTNFLGDFTGSLPLAPGGIPRLKGFLRLEYAWKGWEWVGTVNYIGGYNDDSASLLAASIIGGGDTTPVYDLYRKIPSYVTFDTQLSYEFKKPKAEAAKEIVDGKGVRTQVAADHSGSFAQKLLWGTKIKVGVVNLFDRSPPVVLGAFNDNYDTSNYSIRNRYWYVGINKKF